jgi:hypothetical protein
MYLFLKAAEGFCAGLYGLFGFLAVFKKKPLPLIALLLAHGAEYYFKGRQVAEEKGIDQMYAFKKCMLYGITWWMPADQGDPDVT